MTDDLSTLSARMQLATKYAAKYSLSASLVAAVVEQESAWNPWAIRPEPLFKTRYVDPLYLNTLESWTRSMSWGLMQLMGETARELGFQGLYLSELCNPEVGMDWGCRFLAKKMGQAAGVEEKALLLWNGGSDLKYPGQVLAREAAYRNYLLNASTDTQST